VPTAEYTFPIAAGHRAMCASMTPFTAKTRGLTTRRPTLRARPFNPYFIPNPAYNQLNVHVGMTWSGWILRCMRSTTLNTHPLLFNNARQPFTFYGSAFTVQPLTIGVTAMYHW